MPKKKEPKALNLLMWFTGVIVSLVVGFGMVSQRLVLPTWLGGSTVIGKWLVIIVGWIVIVTTLASAILAILNRK